MKILYLWGHGNTREKKLIQSELDNWITHGYDITPIDYHAELNINNPYEPQELDRLYSSYDSTLLNFYWKILNLSITHDVLMINYGNVLHPEFVRSLKGIIYTVLISGDDPEGSEVCSHPYVSSFDHVFCYGTMYDDKTTIIDKFKEWGAK